MLNELCKNIVEYLTNNQHFCGTIIYTDNNGVGSKLLLEYFHHYYSISDQLFTR
mgnify:FL=1|jgi:hypothetical protein